MDCHSGKEATANLDLEKFNKLETLVKKRKVWQKISHNILHRKMPPKEQEKPEEKDIQAVTAWIDQQLNSFDCQEQRDPGRVTIRRLNRQEFNNTIRDLLGVSFRPADDFPSDDVGYGFDNIGDVLSLSTLLLEKYLAAAEEITKQAIVTDDPRRPTLKRLDAKSLQLSGKGVVLADETRLVTGLGAAYVEHYLQFSAEYVVRARIYGEQAGKDPVKYGLQVDGRFLEVGTTTATREEPVVIEKKVSLGEGARRIAVTFLNDASDPTHPDPAKRERNLAVLSFEIEGPFGLEPSPVPESHRQLFAMPEELQSGEEIEQARYILSRFMRRAFRRPVQPEEVDRFLELYKLARSEGDNFETGIQLAVRGVLVSPHFLFRIEEDLSPNDPKHIHPISEPELATRLSYFLWSSMPDEELLGLAERGELRRGDALAQQVARMLADPRSQAFVDNFAGQWLQLRSLANVSRDPDRFPDFDESLRQAMKEESTRFFESILREDKSILTFLDADYTFLNERLARHYGIDGVEGSELRKVSLPSGNRGGLITQASILTITSNPTRTSPVKRGKWILEELLGEPPPPPPPDVGELMEDESALTGTLRQQMEQHRANPNCATCHARLDPLGFGLENFDAIGAWRDKDGEHPVDASATLPDGQSFTGPRELRQVLATKEREFRRCLTEKLLTYALGRGLEYYDQCAVDAICENLAQDGDRFSRLILEIVHSEPFQLRRGKGEDE